MLIGLKQQDGNRLVACLSDTNLPNTSSTTVYVSLLANKLILLFYSVHCAM